MGNNLTNDGCASIVFRDRRTHVRMSSACVQSISAASRPMDLNMASSTLRFMA